MESTFSTGGFMIGEDPRHPDSIITGEMPSDEHLIAIGKIAVAFTRLEETVSTCFTVLLGCEPELASILAKSFADQRALRYPVSHLRLLVRLS
jgi:hypothetical protein